MTSREWTKEMSSKIKELKSGKAMKLAVTAAIGDVAQRIFEDGKKPGGGKIGTYESKNELYAYDATSPIAVTHKGKHGATIKGGYYKSYKDYRNQQKRESGFVNLRLTNDFQSDYLNTTISKSSNSVGKPKPVKVSNFEYLVTVNRAENVNKYLGFNQQYGDIFSLSAKEERAYKNDFEKQYKVILES